VFDEIVKLNENNRIVQEAVRIIHEEFRVLVESGKIDVLVCRRSATAGHPYGPGHAAAIAEPTAPVLSFTTS